MTDRDSTAKPPPNDAMPSPGSPSTPRSNPDPGAEGGSGSGSGSGSGGGKGHSSKSGSMKVKRTTSGSKVARTKSGAGSMKKKTTTEPKAGKPGDLTDSAAGEMEMLTQKQNGSAGDGGPGGGGTEEQEQDEKKEHRATIKGLWKKAFKSLKSSSGDQKWSTKKGASLKRKDSKEGEEVEPEEPKEIDPVYSLLKCAADLPRATRASKDSGQLTPQAPGGAPCTGLVARHGDSSGSTSKASSPSSSGLPPISPDGICSRCGAVHRVDLLAHDQGLDKQLYKQTTPEQPHTSSYLSNV